MGNYEETPNGETTTSYIDFDLAVSEICRERDEHERLLDITRHLPQEYHIAVKRTYKVKLCKDAVAEGCGIWLQGCCKGRHWVGFVFLQSVPHESIQL